MRIIKRLVFVSLFAVFILGNGHLSFAANKHDLANIETFMDAFLEEKIAEEHIPNLAVAVVQDGEIIFEKGYGYVNLEKEVAVNPESTMFRVGSVSKLFTWTAVMQLVEKGKLDLNTDINEYLDFDIPAELAVGPNKETPEPITLLHLMTHTPGFEDNSSSIIKLNAEEMPPLGEYVQEYRPERIYPAGEVIAYSNYGTALAGYIVEQVSGMSYSDYVEEHILKPLDMNNSTFEQPLPKELSEQLAQGYRYVDGEFKQGRFEFMPGPAGGMSSTAVDMAKFMQAYLDGGSFQGEQILEKATVEQMFQQQFTHDFRLDGMTLGFMESTWNGKRILQHGGNTGVFDAGLYLLPDENFGLFIAYSGNNLFLHKELFNEMMEQYFPAEDSFQQTVMSDKEASSQYVGEYHQNRKSLTGTDKITSLMMGIIHVKSDDTGDLLVTVNGKTNRFVPIESGVYENRREGHSPDAYGEFSTIVFQTDPHGKVMLTADGPMSYSKAPWYASRGFTFLSLIIIILLFVGSLIYWGMKGFKRRKRKITSTKIDRLGKGLAIVTGVNLLLLVLGIVVANGIDPIYNLPKDALGITPAWTPILNIFLFLVTILGIAMFLFMVRIWWRSSWGMLRTLHYSLLSIAIMHFIWIFWYWNLY